MRASELLVSTHVDETLSTFYTFNKSAYRVPIEQSPRLCLSPPERKSSKTIKFASRRMASEWASENRKHCILIHLALST